MVNPNTKPLIIPLSSQQIILLFFFLFQSSYSMTSFAVHSMNAFINVSDVAKAIHRTLRPQTFRAPTF